MKWTVGTKILGGFALSLLVLLAVGFTAYQAMQQLLSATDARQRTYDEILTVEQLLAALKDCETGQRGYLLTGETRYLEPFVAGKGDIDDKLKALRDLFTDDAAYKQHLDALTPLIANKIAELEETVQLRRNSGFDAALQVVMTDRGKAAMDQIREITSEMRVEAQDALTRRSRDAKAQANFGMMVIVAGSLGALVFLSIAGLLIARNIARPLREMTTAAERIAAGELDVQLGDNHHRADEVAVLNAAFTRMMRSLRDLAATAKRISRGDLSAEVKPQSEKDDLANSFTLMTENLRDVMRDVTEAVNVLSASASEIMASTAQVAASASETASAVTETTTTVEEVKQTAQVSSDKGRYVADTAQQAAQVSKRGRASVDQALNGMKRMREQMDSIGASMMKLSEQTLAIGDIIATVNDLAEQSNILAVNASIEAAKAGEQGKGFSVVAQEVRSLAEQSKQATGQVRTLLNDIQKATTAAMLATEQGGKAVDAGLQQSAEAGQSIAALTESISQSAQAATQIAASSQQQLIGMDQVVMAIRNIQEASAQNAASVKQVESAARSLNDLGLKLKAMVGKYKV